MRFNKLLSSGKRFWGDKGHIVKPIVQMAGKITGELANFAQLEKAPTLANYLNIAFNVKQHYVDNFREDNDSYFLSDKWEPIFCYELWPMIVQLVEDFFPNQIVPIKIGNSGISIINTCILEDEELGTMKLGWKKTDTVKSLYVSAGDVDKCKEYFNKNIWKLHQSKCIVIDVVIKDHYAWFILNKQPDHDQFLDSFTGKKYTQHVMKYQDKHLGRSMLFYGPPGTGKSSIVKTITNNLNLRTLRLQNIDSVRNKAIVELLQLVNPEAIVMEDIDHLYSHDSGGLLDKLENFNTSGKYIFATANDITKLNDALLRPGRFDELVEILALDEGSLREITQDEDIIQIVRNFPVAFIMEVLKRVSIQGKENTLNNLGDIYKRLKITPPGAKKAKAKKATSDTPDPKI